MRGATEGRPFIVQKSFRLVGNVCSSQRCVTTDTRLTCIVVSNHWFAHTGRTGGAVHFTLPPFFRMQGSDDPAVLRQQLEAAQQKIATLELEKEQQPREEEPRVTHRRREEERTQIG